MGEKYTEAQKNASLRYAQKRLRRVPLDLKKEEYEMLADAAKQSCMSVNGFIKSAISEKISKAVETK